MHTIKANRGDRPPGLATAPTSASRACLNLHRRSLKACASSHTLSMASRKTPSWAWRRSMCVWNVWRQPLRPHPDRACYSHTERRPHHPGQAQAAWHPKAYHDVRLRVLRLPSSTLADARGFRLSAQLRIGPRHLRCTLQRTCCEEQLSGKLCQLSPNLGRTAFENETLRVQVVHASPPPSVEVSLVHPLQT